MIKNMSFITRMVLTVGLLYGVYNEAGIWTTLSLFLISVYIELQEIIKKSKKVKGQKGEDV